MDLNSESTEIEYREYRNKNAWRRGVGDDHYYRREGWHLYWSREYVNMPNQLYGSFEILITCQEIGTTVGWNYLNCSIFGGQWPGVWVVWGTMSHDKWLDSVNNAKRHDMQCNNSKGFEKIVGELLAAVRENPILVNCGFWLVSSFLEKISRGQYKRHPKMYPKPVTCPIHSPHSTLHMPIIFQKETFQNS